MSAPIPVFSDRPKAVATPKLRALVKFPGNVAATTGIEVTQQSGTYTFELNYGDFATASTLPSGAGNYVLNYDATTQTYVLVPSLALLGSADAYVTKIGANTMAGPLTITSGNLSVVGSGHFSSNIVSDNTIGAGGAGTTGGYYFGNSGTKSLVYDGTNFTLSGAATFIVNSDIMAAKTATTGAYYFGNSGTKFLNYDGTNFNIAGGPLIAPGHTPTNGVNCGFSSKRGDNNAVDANYWNLFWNSTNLLAYVNTTFAGTLAFTSDYRIKKDVIDLPGMWDTVKALRPIKYTQAQFSPPSHVEYVAGLRAKKDENIPGDLFVADDIERWGFIAHELQETLTPSAASGEKDAYDTIQSPNPFTLIAALTKALQEAMERIEALEATATPTRR